MDRYLNVTEARRQLLELVENLHAGDRVVITKHGRRRAVIVDSERYALLEDMAWVLRSRAPGRPPEGVGRAAGRRDGAAAAGRPTHGGDAARSREEAPAGKERDVRRYPLSPQFLKDLRALEPGMSPADQRLLDELLALIVAEPDTARRAQTFYDPQRPSRLVRADPFVVHYAFDADADEVELLNLFRRR